MCLSSLSLKSWLSFASKGKIPSFAPNISMALTSPHRVLCIVPSKISSETGGTTPTSICSKPAVKIDAKVLPLNLSSPMSSIICSNAEINIGQICVVSSALLCMEFELKFSTSSSMREPISALFIKKSTYDSMNSLFVLLLLYSFLKPSKTTEICSLISFSLARPSSPYSKTPFVNGENH